MKKHIVIICIMYVVISLTFAFVELFLGTSIDWAKNSWQALTFIGLGYLFGGLLNRVYKKDE